MNITVLANRDLPSNYALNLMLPGLAERHRLHVFLSGKIGGSKAVPPDLAALKFFEQTLFNELLFPALGGDGRSGEWQSFSALGRRLAIEVEGLDNINKSRSLARFEDTRPDLVLSIRYGSILRDAAIAVPRHGVLNLHSGVLPAYRGVMPTFRALMDGASELGTTLHYVRDATIDTGEVVGETRRAVEEGRSYLWQVLHLYPAGCELMAQTVERIDRGEAIETRPQREGGAYFTFPTEAELETYRRAGHRLFSYDEVVELAQRFLPARTGGAS